MATTQHGSAKLANLSLVEQIMKPNIRGERFKSKRESMGLSIEDLTQSTTFSKQQIQQIENGGTSTFYSAAIKLNCAKKVAHILGLDFDEAFEMQKIEAHENQTAIVSEILEIEAQSVDLESTPHDSVIQLVLDEKKERGGSKKLITWIIMATLIAMLFGFGWSLFPSATKLYKEIFNNELTNKDFREGDDEINKTMNSGSEDAIGVSEQTTKYQSTIEKKELNTPAVTCSITVQSTSNPLEYTPPKPYKTGNQVYVLNKGEAQAICFEDANLRLQQVMIMANEGFTFIGKAPFKIISRNLNQFEIFYQGSKVRSDLLGQELLLKESRID